MIPFIMGGMLLALLLLFAGALGRRILLLIRVRSSSRLERGILSIGLGLGALQFLPFALFAIGMGTPTGIRLASGILAAVLMRDALADASGAWRFFADVGQVLWWQ